LFRFEVSLCSVSEIPDSGFLASYLRFFKEF